MRNLTSDIFLDGKRFFEEGGCASCHIPKMKTGNNSDFAVLNNRTFYPFTNMLLHDMGPELASGFPSFSASPSEWRTAPLWGIGLSEKISGRVGFLHDGRARTIEEAILWHGGEAKRSQEFYKNLNKEQRKKLIYFLAVALMKHFPKLIALAISASTPLLASAGQWEGPLDGIVANVVKQGYESYSESSKTLQQRTDELCASPS